MLSTGPNWQALAIPTSPTLPTQLCGCVGGVESRLFLCAMFSQLLGLGSLDIVGVQCVCALIPPLISL